MKPSPGGWEGGELAVSFLFFSFSFFFSIDHNEDDDLGFPPFYPFWQRREREKKREKKKKITNPSPTPQKHTTHPPAPSHAPTNDSPE